MPFDSSGTFTRTRGRDSWKGDAAAPTPIKADLHDINDNDIADALSNVLTKNGVTQPTADIPLAGHKIINVGQPDNPQDVATKRYVDEVPGWPTAKSITGADTQGRLNFTSLTGANGLTWSNIAASWLARVGVANNKRNRVVLNNNVDGSGTDVIAIDAADGVINYPYQFFVTQNLYTDGAVWRTPVAGTGGYLAKTANAMSMAANYTATGVADAPATLETWFSTYYNAGSVVVSLAKKSGVASGVQITGASGNNARWNLILGDGTAEAAGNVGSNLALQAWGDSGLLFNVMTAHRNDGRVQFPVGISGVCDFLNAVQAPSVNALSGYLYLGGAGGLCLRPNGVGSTTAQSFLTTAGDLAVARYVTASGWLEHQGTGGADGTQYFNSWYVDSANIWCYVGTTHVANWTPACDYRLKKEVEPLTSTWAAVKNLRPVKYTDRAYGELFKDGDATRWGFLAHELQEALLPSAANGEKDGEDLQVPNHMTILAALTATLQEAQLRIEALEERLAA